LRRLIELGRRLLDSLGRWRGGCDCPFDFPTPDENAAILVSRYALGMNNFIFQVFEVGIIEVIPTLDSAIRHASLALEDVDDLCKDVIEGHG
jgi:hypothetical protein